MLVITHFVTFIIPKDSREGEDSNDENPKDLEESNKPEVNSSSLKIYLSLI